MAYHSPNLAFSPLLNCYFRDWRLGWGIERSR